MDDIKIIDQQPENIELLDGSDDILLLDEELEKTLDLSNISEELEKTLEIDLNGD